MSYSEATERAVQQARQQALGDLPRRTAQRFPDKTAIVDGATRLSFSEFNTAVNRCAHALAQRGMTKGDRLALLSHNCWQYPMLTFATAKLGVVLVPINFMLGVDEVAFILDHSDASGLITEDSLAPTATKALEAAGRSAGGVRGWIGLAGEPAPDGWEEVAGWALGSGEESDPGIPIADDDPLRLMYTSGTESRPKGVLLSSRSLISQYTSCAIDGNMSGDDVELHTLPLYHCAQLDCFLSVDIYLGATSVILPGPQPAALLATIEREKVSKLFAPPTVWISLLRHPDFDTRDLSSLRKGYYGASAMPVEVLRELGSRLPDVQFWNFYGQTEMSPLATLLHPHEQLSKPGSAGRASVNVETRVIDDAGNPLPAGEVGEIVHRSPHATLGYYNDEGKTAEAFDGGWFHSGDLGTLDEEGYLYVVDRKKDMIKTGGENVASREVEEALYQLDAIAEVAVFGINHPHWIEAVTAVIIPKPGATLSEDDVHAHARIVLASYKRPKYITFADELPKNPSGKILKRELRTTYAHLADS